MRDDERNGIDDVLVSFPGALGVLCALYLLVELSCLCTKSKDVVSLVFRCVFINVSFCLEAVMSARRGRSADLVLSIFFDKLRHQRMSLQPSGLRARSCTCCCPVVWEVLIRFLWGVDI